MIVCADRAALHEYLVLEFCLTLLYGSVKRGVLAGRTPQLMALLDPALPLLVRALKSRCVWGWLAAHVWRQWRCSGCPCVRLAPASCQLRYHKFTSLPPSLYTIPCVSRRSAVFNTRHTHTSTRSLHSRLAP